MTLTIWGIRMTTGFIDQPFPLADRVFRQCARRAAQGGSRLAPLAAELRLASERLHQPMRVAIVGQIKRGKSTLVNALLGKEIAATGQLELTFTVSEFRYGPDCAVWVHYKDDTSEGPLPPETLDRLTVRDPAMLGKLRSIRMVEYSMPNEMLKDFRLVDTPGLGSVYRSDAQNSLDLLNMSSAEFAAEFPDDEEEAAAQALAAMGRTGQEMHADSARQVASADAIVYLFSRGIHQADYDTVIRFLGSAAADVTPTRAFGVLSRCDENYWPPDRDLPGSPDLVTYDPMAAAAKITGRYLATSGIDSLFYTVLPVAGLLGIGARLLTAEEFSWLEDLSKADARLLARRLSDTARFTSAPDIRDVTLPQPLRGQLIARLGAWGIHLACCCLRAQLGEEQTRHRLAEASGVPRIRDVIVRHFGNHASAIKLDHGICDVVAEIDRRRQELRLSRCAEPPALTDIANRIARLQQDEHAAAELAALASYYRDDLDLDGTRQRELLAVTGAFGTSWAARLGLPEGTQLSELAAAAERLAGQWSERASDLMLDRPTRSVARTIGEAFDILWAEVKAKTNKESGAGGRPA
jgi:hypothetical protein